MREPCEGGARLYAMGAAPPRRAADGGRARRLASASAADESGADPVAQQGCGVRRRLYLAELIAQQLAQLAERPAIARGIERRRFRVRQRAEVSRELVTPQEPLQRRRVEARLRSLAVFGQRLPDLRHVPAKGEA